MNIVKCSTYDIFCIISGAILIMNATVRLKSGGGATLFATEAVAQH